MLGTLLAGASGIALAAVGDSVALVVGNSVYRNAPVLANPKSDAQAVAAALKRIGFGKVTLRENLTNQETRDALRSFARESSTAQTSVIFFAGHGIEVAGQNYLVPTDARLASDLDIAYEAVPLELVLQAVEPAKGLRLVMLDACRDNPFIVTMTRSAGGKRGLGRGLGPIEPGGTLVAYAAKHGQQANDGTGGHSPFTRALLKHIETPALDIGFLFRKVRDDVLLATAGKQEPFSYGSLSGDAHYLVPPRTQPAPTVIPDDFQRWVSIKDSTNAEDFAGFLRRFPDSLFARDAEARLELLRRSESKPAPTAAASTVVAPPQIAAAPATTVAPKALPAPPLAGPQADRPNSVTSPDGRDPTPQRGESTLGLDRPQWEAIQRSLAEQGLYSGRPDGRPGSGTREAIREWQSRQGLPVTGFLTPEDRQRIVDRPTTARPATPPPQAPTTPPPAPAVAATKEAGPQRSFFGRVGDWMRENASKTAADTAGREGGGNSGSGGGGGGGGGAGGNNGGSDKGGQGY